MFYEFWGNMFGIWYTFVASTGYKTAKGASKEALERFLTGKDFETLASLEEKDREAFWELMLLPLAAWGTVAGTVRTVKGLKNAPEKFKTKTKKEVEIQKDSRNLTPKPQISPEDVHIAKTGHNADSQSDVFQVKFKGSNNKEIQFELEISKKRLEQNRLDTEEKIKDVVKFEGLNAKEATKYAAFARKEDDLLLNAQKLISQIPEESLQGRNKISLEELESMAVSKYKDRVFQHVFQNYSRHHNSRLSHIGVKNVHIKKTGHNEDFTEYEVQFKTQKGKKRSLKLHISKEADKNILDDDDLTLQLIKDGEITSQALTMRQKIQLAIGQMPAEIFKGLKSITIHSPDKKTGYAGQVTSIKSDPFLMVLEIPSLEIPSQVKYFIGGLPPSLARLTMRFPINESVVHAWTRVTNTKSHMALRIAGLNNIPPYSKTLDRSRLSQEHLLLLDKVEQDGYRRDLTSVLAHELGHVLQNTKYSRPPPHITLKKTSEQLDRMRNPKDWPEAVKKDGTSVSEYGDTSLTEDFAEAMRVYIQTDGGTKNPQALKDFANRFEILDNLMKASMTERKSLFDKFKKAMEKKGVAFVTKAGVLTHIVVQNQVYIIPPDKEGSE